MQQQKMTWFEIVDLCARAPLPDLIARHELAAAIDDAARRCSEAARVLATLVDEVGKSSTSDAAVKVKADLLVQPLWSTAEAAMAHETEARALTTMLRSSA